MELPILQYLPLSDDARRIVLKFLWTPHPTAVLIKGLTFDRHVSTLSILDLWDHPEEPMSGYYVRGGAFRKRSCTWDPQSRCYTSSNFHFDLDEITGEYPTYVRDRFLTEEAAQPGEDGTIYGSDYNGDTDFSESEQSDNSDYSDETDSSEVEQSDNSDYSNETDSSEVEQSDR